MGSLTDRQVTAYSNTLVRTYALFSSLARQRSGPPSSTGSAMNELSSCDSDDNCDGRDEAALVEAAWAASEAPKRTGGAGNTQGEAEARWVADGEWQSPR